MSACFCLFARHSSHVTHHFSCGSVHLELDLGELVGGLADFAQEGQPARVGVDFVEQIFRYDFAESRVLVCDRFVEPLERFVGIAAERVDVGDVVWRSPFRTSRSAR